MWHPDEDGAYGFEVLRPDEDGEMEILKVRLCFEPNEVMPTEVVVYAPENSFRIFEGNHGIITAITFQDEYLIAYLETGDTMQFKIEPSEGLVCDRYDEFDEIVETLAIWWEDL